MWKKVLFIVVFENCVSLIEMPILNPNSIFFFWNFRVFYFSYHFSIDVDIIETYVYPLYIIVDRNQEFIFLHCKHFVFMKE